MSPLIPKSIKPLLEQIGRIAEARGTSVYAVGGCVRDWCLQMPRLTDLDVTVEGDGAALARVVARTLHGTLRVHPQFGTATVLLGPRGTRRVDVASTRKETYAKPAAYPRVTQGTLEDDLFRRDFTFNAMAVALNPGRFGALVDPFGGMEDLERRRLRILNPRSFVDDPTRILRGIRFAQRFEAHFDGVTAQRLKAAVQAGALGWLNAGRLGKELERMLHEPNPVACLKALGTHLEA